MPTVFDSTFYRVSVKALIFDAVQRLLLFQGKEGQWELPGGGLEYNESLEDCITRELYEEMRLEPASIGRVQFIYGGKSQKGFYKLRIAMDVTLKSLDFQPSDDDIVAARFVTREEFVQLPFKGSEQSVQPYADHIWALAPQNAG